MAGSQRGSTYPVCGAIALLARVLAAYNLHNLFLESRRVEGWIPGLIAKLWALFKISRSLLLLVLLLLPPCLAAL